MSADAHSHTVSEVIQRLHALLCHHRLHCLACPGDRHRLRLEDRWMRSEPLSGGVLAGDGRLEEDSETRLYVLLQVRRMECLAFWDALAKEN